MHFTYDEIDNSSLHQGDIIKRSRSVEDILKNIHPHYFNNKDYKYFMVITQSCDLVRRNGMCSSRYITIAAIRPLQEAVRREIDKIQYSQIEQKLDICNEAKRFKIEQFLERLTNNNEQEYFFLYKEPACGLDENCCAFLRLSIALKSKLHYETLLKSKILQLKESFQHKLGYLVGNSYARVGTEDWLSNDKSKKQRSLIKESIDQNEKVIWLSKDDHKYILKEMKNLPVSDQNINKLNNLLKNKGKEKSKNQNEIIKIICNELEKLRIDDELIKKAEKRIKNKPSFRALIK